MGEFFLEVFAGAAYEPKMPMWARVMILVLIWYGLAGAMLYEAFAHAAPSSDRGAVIALSIIADVFIIFGTVGIVRVFTRKPKPKQQKSPLDKSDD